MCVLQLPCKVWLLLMAAFKCIPLQRCSLQPPGRVSIFLVSSVLQWNAYVCQRSEYTVQFSVSFSLVKDEDVVFVGVPVQWVYSSQGV